MSVIVEQEAFSIGGELYCPSCETMFPDGRLCPNDGARLVKLSLAPDPIIGRELDGRFTVLEKLGEGGMGAVYRAHQHSVDREVAIKVVHVNLVSDPETIKRFLREAKLTSKLNHPNAVGVLDFGQTEDGVFYLVMELVPGKPLDQVLKEEGVLAPARVVRIGMQVCDALETAHALQIVHRDLKPANIMLVESRRDFVKVLDFGLAKTLEMRLAEQSARDETMLGTPAFFPPERAMGSGDARSDLYSLGCVLYLLASGSLPFQADSPTELVAAHQSGRRPTPLANVPPALAQVIDKLLQKSPDHRYQSAGETRDALEEAATVDGILTYQSSPSLEQARLSMRLSASAIEVPPKRKLRGILVLGAGAVALVILVIVLLSNSGRSESSPNAPLQTAKPPPAPTKPSLPEQPPTPTPTVVAPSPDLPMLDKVDLKPTVVRKRLPVRPTPPRPTPSKLPESKPKLPF